MKQKSARANSYVETVKDQKISHPNHILRIDLGILYIYIVTQTTLHTLEHHSGHNTFWKV